MTETHGICRECGLPIVEGELWFGLENTMHAKPSVCIERLRTRAGVLSTALRLAADEPNIDKARAIADAAAADE